MLLCCLPKIAAPQLSYRDVFRVLIVQFMDAQSLDIRAEIDAQREQRLRFKPKAAAPLVRA
jgi:hypothetical protein